MGSQQQLLLPLQSRAPPGVSPLVCLTSSSMCCCLLLRAHAQKKAVGAFFRKESMAAAAGGEAHDAYSQMAKQKQARCALVAAWPVACQQLLQPEQASQSIQL